MYILLSKRRFLQSVSALAIILCSPRDTYGQTLGIEDELISDIEANGVAGHIYVLADGVSFDATDNPLIGVQRFDQSITVGVLIDHSIAAEGDQVGLFVNENRCHLYPTNEASEYVSVAKLADGTTLRDAKNVRLADYINFHEERPASTRARSLMRNYLHSHLRSGAGWVSTFELVRDRLDFVQLNAEPEKRVLASRMVRANVGKIREFRKISSSHSPDVKQIFFKIVLANTNISDQYFSILKHGS